LTGYKVARSYSNRRRGSAALHTDATDDAAVESRSNDHRVLASTEGSGQERVIEKLATLELSEQLLLLGTGSVLERRRETAYSTQQRTTRNAAG